METRHHEAPGTDRSKNTKPSRTRVTLNGWRIAGWGAAAALLALPAILMQFTSEVAWSPGDFVAAALMLAFLGAGVETALLLRRGGHYTAALVLASFTAFFTFWANGAVGIIGSEGNDINLAFYAMVVMGIVAAIGFHLSATAMSRIAALLAIGHVATGLAAELTGTPDWAPVLLFAALWTFAALLFRKAAA